MDYPHGVNQAEIQRLFENSNAERVWENAGKLLLQLSPNFKMARIRPVFDDVIALFFGSYAGYAQIKTPYHDLSHTLSVFMCAVRMLDGIHLAHTPLTDDEISQVMIAALLHDVGYAQRSTEATGTGAQHLRTHIQRGVEFMQHNLARWQIDATWETSLALIIRCTDMGHRLGALDFPDSRVKLLGQIVGSADLIGQMADRIYLEKLLFLYYEFEEADFGGFTGILDLLKTTRGFYEQTKLALEGELGGVFAYLSHHFAARIGVSENLYLKAINNNLAYLNQVITLDEAEWQEKLKRDGIMRSLPSKGNDQRRCD